MVEVDEVDIDIIFALALWVVVCFYFQEQFTSSSSSFPTVEAPKS